MQQIVFSRQHLTYIILDYMLQTLLCWRRSINMYFPVPDLCHFQSKLFCYLVYKSSNIKLKTILPGRVVREWVAIFIDKTAL